jgi:hypothetical protein
MEIQNDYHALHDNVTLRQIPPVDPKVLMQYHAVPHIA